MSLTGLRASPMRPSTKHNMGLPQAVTPPQAPNRPLSQISRDILDAANRKATWLEDAFFECRKARMSLLDAPIRDCDPRALDLPPHRQSQTTWNTAGYLQQTLSSIYDQYGSTKMVCQGPNGNGILWIKIYTKSRGSADTAWMLLHLIWVKPDDELAKRFRKRARYEAQKAQCRETDVQRWRGKTAIDQNGPRRSLSPLTRSRAIARPGWCGDHRPAIQNSKTTTPAANPTNPEDSEDALDTSRTVSDGWIMTPLGNVDKYQKTKLSKADEYCEVLEMGAKANQEQQNETWDVIPLQAAITVDEDWSMVVGDELTSQMTGGAEEGFMPVGRRVSWDI